MRFAGENMMKITGTGGVNGVILITFGSWLVKVINTRDVIKNAQVEAHNEYKTSKY